MSDQTEAPRASPFPDPVELGHALGFTALTPLHGKWMERMLTETKDITLQAHRGSYKTTCLCICIALLMLTRGDQNILFMRKTDHDVAEVVRLVKRILSSAPVARHFGEVKLTRATTAELTCDRYTSPGAAPQLLGCGIGGSLTGKHADIVITDDIVNLSDRLSRADRERTKETYMELQNIRNRGGRVINTGTPWHREDCFSLMPPAEKYDCYSTGLITPEQLKALRAGMSPSLFAANYELRHIAREDALFPGLPQTGGDPALLRDGIAQIDAAYGGGDFTALTCAARADGKLYLYGRLWHGHVLNILDEALAECDRLMCGPVWCETNADKGYLGREIRARGHEARMYPENQNKYYKISSWLRRAWEEIVFVRGTDREYIAQITDYTEDAAHDDAPDSAASAIRVLERRGTPGGGE